MSRALRTDYIELRKKMAENEIRTIKNLSDSTGINRNTLSKILSGSAQPSSDSMEKLVVTLHIEPEEAGKIFFTKDLRNT